MSNEEKATEKIVKRTKTRKKLNGNAIKHTHTHICIKKTVTEMTPKID